MTLLKYAVVGPLVLCGTKYSVEKTLLRNTVSQPDKHMNGTIERASPATVGRCGMMFMEEKALGWRPLKVVFLESLPRVSFTEESIEWLDELFEWLVPSCLGQIGKKTQMNNKNKIKYDLCCCLSYLFVIDAI